MHGLVALDENDEVIRPAILWNDNRTSKQGDYLNNVIGKETLAKYTSNISFAGKTMRQQLSEQGQLEMVALTFHLERQAQYLL